MNAAKQDRESEWQSIFVDWDKSEKSGASYCREHGYSYWRFVYWKKRLRGMPEKKEAENFVALRVDNPPSTITSPISIRIGSAIRLELGHGFDESELACVIRILREHIC